jgi:hypothetical protein
MNEYVCPGDCCDNCVEDSYRLIGHLIKDIQLLSSEVVRLRYSLSWHLQKDAGEMVRCEIAGDLHGCYYGYPAYQRFVSECCGGDDPFEGEGFCSHLAKLSEGEVSDDEFRSLTF